MPTIRRARLRSFVIMMTRVRADNLGNIVLRTGKGSPHTLIVAPLDESGFVVSAITDDGYLRVHRPGAGPSVRLGAQFFVGQPILIRSCRSRSWTRAISTRSCH